MSDESLPDHIPGMRCPECGALDTPRGMNHVVGCVVAINDQNAINDSCSCPWVEGLHKPESCKSIRILERDLKYHRLLFRGIRRRMGEFNLRISKLESAQQDSVSISDTTGNVSFASEADSPDPSHVNESGCGGRGDTTTNQLLEADSNSSCAWRRWFRVRRKRGWSTLENLDALPKMMSDALSDTTEYHKEAMLWYKIGLENGRAEKQDTSEAQQDEWIRFGMSTERARIEHALDKCARPDTNDYDIGFNAGICVALQIVDGKQDE